MECGLSRKKLQQLTGFQLTAFDACMVSYEHKDHSHCVADPIKSGLPVYMSQGTAETLELEPVTEIRHGEQFTVGSIDVVPFDTFHDAAEPLGFLFKSRIDGDGLFGDLIPDQRATATMESVEEREYRKQLHEALEKALSVIPENYSEILRLRYYQGMTLDDAGKLLGISGEQARQREGKGIRRLRNPSLAATLRPFYNFDFYCGTGLSAFRSSGLSVQERYLLKAEEQQQKAEARKQKREQRRREDKIRNDFALSMEQLMAEVNARVSAMTPEEKRALLDGEKQGL